MKYILVILLFVSGLFGYKEKETYVAVPPAPVEVELPVVVPKVTPKKPVPAIELTQFENTLFQLTNSERKEPLVLSSTLEKIAEERVEYLCSHPFEHGDWYILMDKTDFPWIGENLARHFGDDAAATHKALMESPEHKANILDSHYSYVGIAHKCDVTVVSFGGYNK